ncbi:MAG: hypothetical protein HY063_09445 [Bacteroidetes bacterium]|nr:hypothetical protein [Bacteroidota bacterium]
MEQEIKTFVTEIGAVELSPEAKKFFNRDNYFKFPNTQTLLITKISRSKKPFYGVDSRVIEVADEKCPNYFLILLSSNKSGWIFSKREISLQIKNGFWRVAADKNHKINYGDLINKYSFSSIKQFFERVEQRGGKGVVRIKISDLNIVPYADISFPEPRIVNIADEEIQKAVNEKRFDKRGFQSHLAELTNEWNSGNADYEEYIRRYTKYHIERIAYLIESGLWKEPIAVCADLKTIKDGLHRVLAAKFLKESEIESKIIGD